MNTTSKLIIHYTGLIALCLFLTNCGYHLRGALALPTQLNNLYLTGETTQLRAQFSKSLQLSAGQLNDSPNPNSLTIQINKEDMQRRILSLSSRGRSNEFELVYRLNYSLLDTQQNPLLKNQSLEIRREYFNNQQDILAKDNEETVIRDEMYQQAVQTILNIARSVLTATP